MSIAWATAFLAVVAGLAVVAVYAVVNWPDRPRRRR